MFVVERVGCEWLGGWVGGVYGGECVVGVCERV